MILNKNNTKNILYTLVCSLVYSFVIFYINTEKIPVSQLSIYCLLFILTSTYISANIESKNENYFYSRLIKNILLGLVLSWIIYPSLITQMIAVLIGFKLATKKKPDKNNFSFNKYVESV